MKTVMKRTAAMLVAVMLLVGMLPMAAFAANTEALALKANAEAVDAGQEFSVDLTYTGEALGGLSGKVVYANAVYTGIENLSAEAEGDVMVCTGNDLGSAVNIAWVNSNECAGTDVAVLRLYFTAVEAGDASVSLDLDTVEVCRTGTEAGGVDTFALTITEDPAVVVALNTPLEITTQPVSVTVEAGAVAEFTVASNQEDAAYRWYYSKNNGETWSFTSLTGYNTATLSVEALESRNGYQYKCRVTGADGTVIYSDVAVLTVEVPAEALAITSQPASVTVEAGGVATFTVVANQEDAAYKWYYSKNGGSTWPATSLTGYNTATLTVDALESRNGYQYKCRVTGADGTVIYSDVATLTVEAPAEALAITSQPASVTVEAGGVAVFTVAANQKDASYRWYYAKSATGSWNKTSLTGYNTDTLTVDALESRNGYVYKCLVTGADGTQIYSDVATLTVEAPAEALAITSQPASVTVAPGDVATFTVAANQDDVTYRWYYAKSATSSWNKTSLSGYNTATLSVDATAARNGYVYKCLVTGADGTQIYSDVATLTVETPAEALAITSQPASVTAAPGDTANFTVAVNQEGAAYKWYYSKNGGSTWPATSLTGYNTATLSVDVTDSRDGYMYKCRVTGADGTVVWSDVATLNVKASMTITSQPASATVAEGETANFTVAASSDDVTYKWYYSKDGGASFHATSLSGYNTATLSVEATAGRNGYQYKCRVTGADGSVVWSDVATLTLSVSLTVTAQPEDATVAVGGTATFTVAASSDDVTYKWYYSKDGGASFHATSLSGYNTATLSVGVTAARDGYQYKCRITGADGTVIWSNAAVLNVGGEV